MEKERSAVKRLLAFLFIAVLSLWFVKSDSYKTLITLVDYLKQDYLKQVRTAVVDDKSISEIEDDFSAGLWKRNRMIDFSGYMAKQIHNQGYYNDQNVYIADSEYIVARYAETSTDYEVEQTLSLRDFLEENDIRLLYVNEPTKYTDDAFFRNSFGFESYGNRNTDLFLSRIRAAGVNTIDLRDNLREEGIDVRDIFYRTDHHWTVPAGLWAAKIMAEGLNQYCGYNIDLSVYDPEKYEIREWKSCWLGEQGRKVGALCVGLDDYTEVKPRFETAYTFKNKNGTFEGTFDNFVDEETYHTGNDVYNSNSWHYSYSMLNCINHNVTEGKVLLLGDSYDHVTQCFLSLGIHELDAMIRRERGIKFDLRNMILQNGYDTVIIAYAQTMIGRHVDPSTSGYRMFIFD